MESYQIIGGDGKEYGPASAEEVRRWLAEGRLNSQSRVRRGGETDWKPVAAFPEFGAVSAGAVPPPLDTGTFSEGVLARDVQVRIGSCLARSWRLLGANTGLLLAASFLVWAIGIAQFIPLLGLVYKIGFGALYGGFYMVFLKRIRGQPSSVGEAFSGFRANLGQLVLAGFISSFLSAFGFVFCVVPGLYLLVAWVFSVPLVADKQMEFWAAMELSRKVVTRAWFPMLGLLAIAFLPLIIAVAFAASKMALLLVPLAREIVTSGLPAPEHLKQIFWELQKSSLAWGLLTRVVLLFNLPFATGALMYAYEDLFGARRTPSA